MLQSLAVLLQLEVTKRYVVLQLRRLRCIRTTAFARP